MTALSLFASADGGGGGGIASLLVLLLIPFAMYFFLIRPQRKRMKDQASLQSSLGVGDEVITTSGVYGFITGEEDDLFWLEVDDDVQIRIAKAAIQNKVKQTADTETESDEASDSTDVDADSDTDDADASS